MKHSKILLITACIAVVSSLTGCTSLENYFVSNQADYAKTSVNGPMTAIEYTNKVSRTINPLMSEAETLLAQHLEVVKGTFPVAQENEMTDVALNDAQTAIETIDGLYQPSSYSAQKAQTIVSLNAYKDSLKRFKAALIQGDKNQINSTADGIKAALASLKTASEMYQG